MPENQPQIVMRSGPIPGTSFTLTKDETYLGRDLSNDIPVPDPEISRRHSRFLLRPEGVFIEDLGSTNGTFVNGVRIAAPQILTDGDLITLAESTVMSFEHKLGTAVPAPSLADTGPRQVAAPAPQPVPTPPTQVYEPVQAPVPSRPVAEAPRIPTEKKPMGWCSIVLIILLIALVVIALVLIFMPASWWCTLSFNAIPGCPIQ